MITLVKTRRELYDRFLPKNCVGAELGVYTGTNSVDLLNITQATKIYLCDCWLNTDDTYDMMLKNTKGYSQFEIVKQFDHDWLPTIPNGVLDWAYLDTVHTYNQTVLELRLLRNKVTQVIAGHDLCCTAIHNSFADDWSGGIMRALMEAIAEGWLEPIALVLSDTGSCIQDQYPSWACKVRQ